MSDYFVGTLLIRTISRITTTMPIIGQIHMPPPDQPLIHPSDRFIMFFTFRFFVVVHCCRFPESSSGKSEIGHTAIGTDTILSTNPAPAEDAELWGETPPGHITIGSNGFQATFPFAQVTPPGVNTP